MRDNTTEETRIKPFLKWAGGKFKLVEELKKRFPKNRERFIEPFLGAGAVSLNVDYNSYIVNDINKDLILVWQNLKHRGIGFIHKCQELFTEEANTQEVYYKRREEFNDTEDALRKSTLFIYLNRHCFNGLCRYNQSGGFNVPFGKYDKPYFPTEELEKCLDKVRKFEIYSTDFREVLDKAGAGDIAYCDPPYLPISESANFDSYSSGGFSLKDHIDLAKYASRAASRGAIVVISNHYNWYSKQIYSDIFGGKVSTIDVSRVISCKADSRESVKEIIAVFDNS